MQKSIQLGSSIILISFAFVGSAWRVRESCWYTISWQTRYLIALGAARRLAYLHENCVYSIIHCNIKPENILLDVGNCSKLADFGVANLLGREFSRVLTTMRGTVGYLAPEWITPKALNAFGTCIRKEKL